MPGAASECKQRFTQAACPVCGSKTKGCSEQRDGLIRCRGAQADSNGYKHLGAAKGDPQWHLFRPRDDAGSNGRPHIIATYDYRDETGSLRFQVVRLTPKGFFQRRPRRPKPRNDVEDDWINGLGGMRPSLYRLPELLAAPLAEPVFIPEGEKDVDRLRQLGLTATTNAMGAGKWKSHYNEALRGRRVILLPDNDEAGRKHAEDIRQHLAGVAASVVTVMLPELPSRGDVSDWLDCGGTKHALLELAANAAPLPATAEPWDDPLPLGEAPEVEPFPLDVLPAPACHLVQEIAWAMNCAPDLAGVALLALAGGAVANARYLAITDTHLVSPCLYAVVVAPPGMTKSPPLRLLRRPFDLAEGQYRKTWKAELERWKEGEKEDRGPKPTLKRCQVGNITTESLQVILDENARGVLMIRNELSGFVAGLNQYKNGGGGDDRQFYLDLWDGTPIITDRKSDRTRDGAPVFVLDAFTAIYGTIQPDVIAAMRLGMGRRHAALNDGFLDRFLFSFPRDLPVVGEQWRAVPAKVLSAWEDAVKELLSLQMREEKGKPLRPVLLKLATDGRGSWQRFTEHMAAEMNEEDFPPHLRGPWVKLRAYGARLALILRCLRWSYRQELNRSDDLGEVDGASMDGAARLVSYFKSHARKVYAVLDADPRHREAKLALRWLARSNSLNCLNSLTVGRVVSKSELHAGVWGGRKDVDEVSDIIALLVRYGWLRLLLEEEKKGPGRRASPRYEVHPAVFRQRSENSDNSENCPREPGEEG